MGLEKEGWFDPWSFLCILKRGALSLGAKYVDGEVVKFNFVTKQDYVVDGDLKEFQCTNQLVVCYLKATNK